MPLINIKDAVNKAKLTLLDLFADDIPRAVALEEIELVEQGSQELWAVTLGFHRARSVTRVEGGIADIYQPPSQIENRVYKTIFINAQTGEFEKMEMRLVG